MIECNSAIKELIPLYYDYELSESEIIKVNKHVAICDECHELLLFYKEIHDELSLDEIEAPQGFHQELMAKIKAKQNGLVYTDSTKKEQGLLEKNKTDKTKSFYRKYNKYMNIAAALMFVVLLGTIGLLNMSHDADDYKSDTVAGMKFDEQMTEATVAKSVNEEAMAEIVGSSDSTISDTDVTMDAAENYMEEEVMEEYGEESIEAVPMEASIEDSNFEGQEKNSDFNDYEYSDTETNMDVDVDVDVDVDAEIDADVDMNTFTLTNERASIEEDGIVDSGSTSIAITSGVIEEEKESMVDEKQEDVDNYFLLVLLICLSVGLGIYVFYLVRKNHKNSN